MRVGVPASEAPPRWSTMRASMVGMTMAWVTCSSLHGGQPEPGVEAVEVDDAPAGVEVGEQIGHAGDVVGRDGHQGGLLLAGAAELARREQVRHQVPVAQDGGLGGRRRPAGVEEEAGDVGVLLGGLGRVPPGQRVVEGLAGDPPVGVGEGTGLALVDHERAGVLVELRGQLVVAEPVVHRDERDAGAGRPEEGDRVGQVVRAQVDDRGHRPLVERRRGRPRTRREVGIADGGVPGGDRHAVAEPGGGHAEDEPEVHGVSPRRGAASPSSGPAAARPPPGPPHPPWCRAPRCPTRRRRSACPGALRPRGRPRPGPSAASSSLPPMGTPPQVNSTGAPGALTTITSVVPTALFSCVPAFRSTDDPALLALRDHSGPAPLGASSR